MIELRVLTFGVSLNGYGAGSSQDQTHSLAPVKKARDDNPLLTRFVSNIWVR